MIYTNGLLLARPEQVSRLTALAASRANSVKGVVTHRSINKQYLLLRG